MSYSNNVNRELDRDNRVQSLRAEAEKAFHDADYEKGIALQTELLKANPEDAQAFCNRGLCNANMGNHLAAIADYSQAAQLLPESLFPFYNRGISLVETGCHMEALSDFSKAIDLSGGKQPQIFIWRGLCYKELGDYERAVQEYTVAITLDPKSTGSYLNRALAFVDAGKLGEALEDLNLVLSIEPGHADAKQCCT
jgi:tetratricopeptide (TPR) repeat protein